MILTKNNRNAKALSNPDRPVVEYLPPPKYSKVPAMAFSPLAIVALVLAGIAVQVTYHYQMASQTVQQVKQIKQIVFPRKQISATQAIAIARQVLANEKINANFTDVEKNGHSWNVTFASLDEDKVENGKPIGQLNETVTLDSNGNLVSIKSDE